MKQLCASFLIVVMFTTHCFSEEQPTLKADIVGLWMMGQSLCEGAESLPVVTPTDQGWGNYRFKRGVRTWMYGDHCQTPEDRSEEQFKFVPLSATKHGGLGETIANGLADHLKSQFTAPKLSKDKSKAASPHFLTAYAGQGGRLIDELSSIDQSTDPRTPESRQHGGGYYKTSLDDARRAKAQAESMGKKFSIAALIWMQGEANGGPKGGINPSRWGEELTRPDGQKWYRDRLIEYRNQWSHDLQLITGQVDEIPMFTYQTQGAAGEAQLMAADRDPNISMVGPHYMVPSAANSRYSGRYGDPIHLSADGQRWYGEQVAKVVHRVLQEGEEWEPLRPRKAIVAPDRKSVLVEFLVPRPPLVLDETFLPRQRYPMNKGFHSLYGFQIRDADRAVSEITEITVESPTSLRIELTSPLDKETTATLSYGLPYADRIGTILDIRKGPNIDDQPTTDLLVEAIDDDRLKPLIAEGIFYVSNMLSGEAYSRAPIRLIQAANGKTANGKTANGTTTLRFQNRELRNNKSFATGQKLTAMRAFSYGNLRDSDSEKAIYHFADGAYGTRVDQPYPLWNWCVLFNQFPISEQ
ncbi:phosphate ABC transporter substrate-binding protein [Thalassoglobus polymorphus]|uniref:Phosphate ABC transporter substrate-binding protein n=1 Tax=Thalassoglobus polymorphus TaxID=2527994 RepID=A0A517QT93_9PLAN|nr:phosphate ABC transporter substrate-binding protein [Thalassoglobus polymorphus]QDT34853.1 hypothetical protein Mal48_41260 [Thalassoglobus polymorphus]